LEDTGHEQICQFKLFAKHRDTVKWAVSDIHPNLKEPIRPSSI
jgi:hypothetical protein